MSVEEFVVDAGAAVAVDVLVIDEVVILVVEALGSVHVEMPQRGASLTAAVLAVGAARMDPVELDCRHGSAPPQGLEG